MKERNLFVDHAGDIMPGTPNSQWYVMPSPARLPFFMSRFPDTNVSHILHSALFVQHTVELGSRNMTSLASDLNLNLTKATPIGGFLSSQIEEINAEDIRKILLSWCLPNQVQLDVIADSTDSIAQLAFYSLLAKLMFSTTPGCRNVTVACLHSAS